MAKPVIASLKKSVKETAKTKAKSPDSFAVQLGCLSDKDEVIYRYGKVRNKRFYHLTPLTIQRPDWGVTQEKVTCQTCKRNIYVTVYSRAASRLKRLSALGFSILPLLVVIVTFVAIDIINHRFSATEAVKIIDQVKGFATIIFLALCWMTPVFLPVVFRKEHKLSLHLLTDKKDRQHRFYETNVASVTQEVYYK